jgi:hypothetical protein
MLDVSKVYKPKREADENQRAALAAMKGRPFFALLMAMRTRKTKVTLDEFGELELEGKVKDFLLIAPGGVYKTWKGAIEGDFSEDLQERAKVLVWESAKKGLVSYKKELQTFMTWKGPRVLLINAEALSIAGSPGRELVIAYLAQQPSLTYVAIDESTCIKNRSKRTLFVIDHIRPLARYRRILSGLSTPRSLLDVFWQWKFLDERVLGHRTYITFVRSVAHTKMETHGGRHRAAEIIDDTKGDRGFFPDAVEQVKAKIAPYSFRVEFRPKVPSTFEVREVEMTKEQKDAYASMKKYATAALATGGHVTATVVIAQIVRLHQILLGHVVDEDGTEHVLPENRTEALLDVLRDYEGKAIIWASYNFDIRKIAKALEEEFGGPIARFWGGNLESREEEERMFKEDPACRFMVATPDAGGKGRTWDCADLAVFYSNRDNLELRDQAENRTMGKDKEKGVDNVDLVVRGTVDEKILDALRRKINMATAINGDSWREWVV